MESFMPRIVNRFTLPGGWTPRAIPSLTLNAIDCSLMVYLSPGESVSVTLPSGSTGRAVASTGQTPEGGFVKNSLLDNPLQAISIPNTVEVCPTDDLVPDTFGNVNLDLDRATDATGTAAPEGQVAVLDEDGNFVLRPATSVAADAATAAAEAVPGASTDVIAAAAAAATTAAAAATATTEAAAESTTTGEQAGQRFCGTEERVSTHTCNSLHPALDIDPSGNIAVAWHDTRDGVHEIYFKTLASKISQREALEALAARDNELLRTINLNCPFPATPEDAGATDLVSFPASDRCEDNETTSEALVRSGSGRLDVDVINRSMTLSVLDGSINFFEAGIQPGASLKIENGANSGLEVVVTQVLASNILETAFVDGATTDTGFSFAILANPGTSLTTCETRLTCNKGTSVFPDVVADRDGRFHVVFQSNQTGENQLYYVQLAPEEIGIKDGCVDGSVPINVQGGFGEVPAGTPGSISFRDNTDPDNPVIRAYPLTGENGDFFSYGNRFLIPASPNNSPFLDNKTGRHRLFRDFAKSSGKWAGTSLADDREAWNIQISALNQSLSPDVVFGDDHPIAEEGDFGTRHNQDNVSFLVQTPPTAGVSLRTVALPIKPKCAPKGPSGTVELREQDLVQAPKRPLPPSFEDPVDLSQILNGPNVQIDDETPGRFVIEGDAGGTVFTNVIQEDARGRLSRLVFRKDTEGEEVKFILGQQLCGDFPCGVRVAQDALDIPPSVQYKITLEVWQGSDYRADPSQITSAQMNARLIFKKEFKFDQNAEVSAFVFKDGELTLPQGAIIFFVPIAGDNTEFIVDDAVGGGNTVWLTSSDGTFENYNTVPFTLRPYTGLNIPVYYDGTLVVGQIDAVATSGALPGSITTRTATIAASIAFGQKGEDDTLATAYAVSQGFSLAEDRTVTSFIIRMARGTSAGIDSNGNSVPEDSSRTLVVELFDDNNGVAGENLLFSTELGAENIRGFDDFEQVPQDADMADLVVSLPNVRLDAGPYHIVLREGGDEDAGGRFWVLSSVDNLFPIGSGLWNSSRPIDSGEWRFLSGQIQLSIILAPERST